jgi:curli biogenesis system outer membrane secretion channel CsgG
MNATSRRALLLAIVMLAAATASAQRASLTMFTGADEEIGALIAWTAKNPAATMWWTAGGALAAQDVFVTEIVATGKVGVVEREQLEAVVREMVKSASGNVDQDAAATLGKRLGFRYLAVAVVTEMAVVDKTAGAVVRGRLIDTNTGEIVWADEARVSVGGFGGGVDDERMFNTILKPAIQQLVAKLVAEIQ